MAKKTYGVVYERDGWRILRHQSRAGEVFSIERVGNSGFKIAGLQMHEAMVEVHFEPTAFKLESPDGH